MPVTSIITIESSAGIADGRLPDRSVASRLAMRLA
jgi:hypothetical protein